VRPGQRAEPGGGTMSNWIRSREFPRAQLVRWLDGSGSPAALPLSLEQAIIRSHPQVQRKDEALRLAQDYLRDIMTGDDSAEFRFTLSEIEDALAPWEETTNG
jgi:hypothetical protein